MLAVIESPRSFEASSVSFSSKEGKEAKGEREKRRRKDGQSNSTLKPEHRDGGGWRKNAATPHQSATRGALGLGAFLRLIKDIRGRLTRYFSPPSANRGAQPPATGISQEVDEGIFVL